MSTLPLPDLIDRAIQTRGALRMYYQNNQGESSTRVVEPLRWDNDYVFIAYCHLRKEERQFKLRNVLEWQYFDSAVEALAYNENPPIAQAQPPAVIAAEAATRINAVKNRTQKVMPEPFIQVANSEQWSRLLTYYKQCLIREYQQLYELERQYIQPFSLPASSINSFMQSETALEFKFGYRLDQDPVVNFIKKNQANTSIELCVGYPFLVLSADKIYPLIYSTIEVKATQQSLIIQANGFEVSYAALKSLGLEDEEISSFLEECEQVSPIQGQSLIEALQALVLAKINEFYPAGLPTVTDKFTPMSIYANPALFWVTGNNITGKLIEELDDLSHMDWNNIPAPLKQLMTILPDHQYPQMASQEQDQNIYVTAVNPQQQRAVHAVETEPVVIVTGPPGTGKSQLVLNLIARAFMKGESVLFASRNNRAVDVVMNRLQNELQFQGSVRTGSIANRERAAKNMRAALASVATGQYLQEFDVLAQSYYQAQEDSREAQTKLKEIKRLSGLQSSCQAERTAYLGFLDPEISAAIVANVPVYLATEIDILQTTLSGFLENGLAYKEIRTNLEIFLREIESGNKTQSDLIAELKSFEDQWGAFGGGFIRARKYQKWGHLQAHLQEWLDLIAALELMEQKARLSSKITDLNKRFSATTDELGKELVGQIERFASANPSKMIKNWGKQAGKLHSDFAQLEKNQFNFWARIEAWLTNGKNLKNKTRLFVSLQDQTIVVGEKTDYSNIKVADLVRESEELLKFFIAVAIKQTLSELTTGLQNIISELLQKTQALPAAIRNDLNKLPKTTFDHANLRAELLEIQSKATSAQSQCDQLAEIINQKLFANDAGLQMLKDSVGSPAGSIDSLWLLSTPVDPEIIVEHITKWHNILSFWKANAGLTQVSEQLAQLPSETEAVVIVKQATDELLKLSGAIMRATWLERAQKANNETIQKTHDYVTAIETLAGKYDPSTYQYFKGMAERNLQYAVNVFPVWATTNLTAKTNFPLVNGFFDLVIIDEASQCDLPSALPLLFRARKIVIIGDPNQLRHVATLKPEADLELVSRNGVSPDAYSYNRHSLFDIAQRSSGAHPGTLLLNEHYRSDQRIINFSNHEFYDDKLVIKTDLSVRGIPKDFLNEKGGIFWLNIPGQSERAKGSNYNAQELAAIENLVPMLFESLKKHELSLSSIGLVTPYRAQEDRIQNWARSRYSGSGQITIGTAHQFQGDERDFMIFSPVAAPGMGEGSIKWLDKEKNLLNVAVTRARISLIVVGDWNYCMSLPVSHSFRHLAEYAQKQDRVANDLKELPFFGKPAFNIVGYVTDPHNPEYNKTTLRRFISSCNEFVWWTDPFLTSKIFDLFFDVFQESDVNIKQVLLLTSKEQTLLDEGFKTPKLDPSKLIHWRTEFGRRGIEFDLRLANKFDLPHDRYLYSENLAINMPPFNQAAGGHGNVSEYTQSNTNKDLFLQVWDKAKPIGEE